MLSRFTAKNLLSGKPALMYFL